MNTDKVVLVWTTGGTLNDQEWEGVVERLNYSFRGNPFEILKIDETENQKDYGEGVKIAKLANAVKNWFENTKKNPMYCPVCFCDMRPASSEIETVIPHGDGCFFGALMDTLNDG